MGEKRKQGLSYHLSPITTLSCSAFLAVACEEAGAAIDWTALRGIEGNCSLLAALRALNGDLYALANAGGLGGGDCCEPFVLGLFAGLASLGFILQTFVMKEDLLASSPDEIICTVNTLN